MISSLTKVVLMTVVCWVPRGGVLHESWRLESDVPLAHCVEVQALLAGGGRAAAITVRCGPHPPFPL